MSIFSNSRRYRSTIITLAAVASLASFGAAFAGPNLDSSVAYNRELRAEAKQPLHRNCVPANGAQIMGNFAGADDRIDSVTGEICRR